MPHQAPSTGACRTARCTAHFVLHGAPVACSTGRTWQATELPGLPRQHGRVAGRVGGDQLPAGAQAGCGCHCGRGAAGPEIQACPPTGCLCSPAWALAVASLTKQAWLGCLRAGLYCGLHYLVLPISRRAQPGAAAPRPSLPVKGQLQSDLLAGTQLAVKTEQWHVSTHPVQHAAASATIAEQACMQPHLQQLRLLGLGRRQAPQWVIPWTPAWTPTHLLEASSKPRVAVVRRGPPFCMAAAPQAQLVCCLCSSVALQAAHTAGGWLQSQAGMQSTVWVVQGPGQTEAQHGAAWLT